MREGLRTGAEDSLEAASALIRGVMPESCHRQAHDRRECRRARRRIVTDTATPHVIVIGGGFGGLWATRALASAPVRVTLVDRANHHLFQPLLYQVATAGL